MHQDAMYASIIVPHNGPMGMHLSSSNILCGILMRVDICVLNVLAYLILTISSVRRDSIFSASSEAVAPLAVPPEAG